MERLSIRIYNVAGELIRTLAADGGITSWDLTASNGSEVAAGVYVAVMSAEKAGAVETRTVRIVVLQ